MCFRGKSARLFFRISLKLMRAKLLVGRSQTFLMCFFICGFCCLLPLTSVYYIFDKNASAFLYIFGFYSIPVHWEFSTGVEKYPEHPYLDFFPFCFIKTEQRGVLNILFQSWTFSFSTSYAGQPAEPPLRGEPVGVVRNIRLKLENLEIL